MILGRVVGKVWSSRRIPSMPAGALLEVELKGGATLVAFDPLGCNAGEEVLITQGSVAASYFSGKSAPVDALIIGSVDERDRRETT